MEAFIGQILTFAGSYAPQGWLACDGSVQSIQDYDALFTLIGTTYGGDGASTFGLPNLSGRVAIHQGTGASGTTYLLGFQGGTTSVTLTQDNLPTHNHALNVISAATTASPSSQQLVASQSNGGSSAYATATTTSLTAMASGSIGSAGGNQAHLNVQPSLAVVHCICTAGIYPQFD